MSDPVKPESISSTEAVATPGALEQPEATPPMPPPSAPPSAQEFLDFEGTTIFAPSPSTTYRYSLSLKSGNLRIWLENGDTKKQWCTTELSLHDYVDASNVIPDATASDYVECFQELLSTAAEDVANIPGAFQRGQDGVFQLKLSVKVQVLRKARVATYTFVLEEISVERIDVLESKLRDLQDKVSTLRMGDEDLAARRSSAVQRLEEDLKKLQKSLDGRDVVISQLKDEVKALQLAQESSVVIPVQATTKALGDLVCWRNAAFIFGLNASVTGLDGIVRAESPGTYQVTAVVNHQPAGLNSSIQMMKGSDCIQSAYCGHAQGNSGSTSLNCTARLDKNDQLTVKCPANLTGTSYLTLIRLGK
ncbi:hypothetical protein PHYSODRAFT_246669 [Phytophthora sojae]|uniref:Uncharacterized protein n=1 Tax=Phytophthora sojae (strain P6497) TaxID=1094619 RepID=G5ADL1_PHYSP|nr:hypothetical protein PHYSODRAFT_246669 [Phytophthora sojae]EGZ06264.1 hypothetical protein PHYSODRAFT_246669 [Phytophthora sojae]|eukprot:XP_009538161.1 hypothetical protein PHYSODRAFT_246669 [Phytophthora sojae]